MSRHAHAGWYTPVDPDTRCNCGECYGCRKGQARAKVDSAIAGVERAMGDLNRAHTALVLAQTVQTTALEQLAEVKP